MKELYARWHYVAGLLKERGLVPEPYPSDPDPNQAIMGISRMLSQLSGEPPFTITYGPRLQVLERPPPLSAPAKAPTKETP